MKLMRLFILILYSGFVFACRSSSKTNNSEDSVFLPNSTENPNSGETQTDILEEEYIPTDEEYKKAFDDIENLIIKLNHIIRNRQYTKWENYLTEKYKNSKGNPVYLKKLSEKPIIKNQRITLKKLKDYFYHVVVPSRLYVKLDKIIFIDERRVKAYTLINEEYIILYYLEKQDNEWKISIW